ncbi:hypothetical protein M431DRAFT_507685 [Trichoderma harzianum CBS 226.95]|uniref:Uncharacterized protein n=1 Tax=Trichoderma harzianum CBS 226.95 TaxID=983964 RepID=A0A2T4AG19_TRIHA|nr:hypothetical protein M431DRAFT_507685 [Trichoderma harzianum CBS 226.95]PTB56017.1 hypothetical protein M431DRAFT_507685 [Trichoderma harzianum CBS 226.95]
MPQDSAVFYFLFLFSCPLARPGFQGGWTQGPFFLDGPQGVPLIAARSARAGIKLESHSWDPLAGHMGLVSDSFEMAFSMPKLVAAAGFDTSLIWPLYLV